MLKGVYTVVVDYPPAQEHRQYGKNGNSDGSEFNEI